MSANEKYQENLAVCFRSEATDRDNFTISAIQKACHICFFEARDTINYGMKEGLLLCGDASDGKTPIRNLRFSPAFSDTEKAKAAL